MPNSRIGQISVGIYLVLILITFAIVLVLGGDGEAILIYTFLFGAPWSSIVPVALWSIGSIILNCWICYSIATWIKRCLKNSRSRRI
jgi:membrane protein DedA with SNARE-associated domain